MNNDKHPAFDSTETIDLATLGLDHLSESGSFVVSAIEGSSFAKLIHGIPMPVLWLDLPEPYILLVNRAADRLMRHSSRMKGRSLFDFFSGSGVRNVQRAINKLYTTRKHQEMQIGMRTWEGQKWVRIHFQSLRLSNKRYALLMIEDLTHEREELARKAEELKRQNEALLQEVHRRSQAERELNRKRQSLEKVVWDTIGALSKISEMRDPYTAGHQVRVTQLARAIAREMGLSERLRVTATIAAAVHDIGKVRVPSEFLSKPGDLDENEFAILKRHPRDGYEVLKKCHLPSGVAEVVLQHHERMNGEGYPDALQGNDIRLEARILAVSDVVEAMSAHRPYRLARGTDAALEAISDGKGPLFFADAVDACITVFRKGFEFKADNRI
jgi:putative nucleotidyltransferase with HDIG domain